MKPRKKVPARKKAIVRRENGQGVTDQVVEEVLTRHMSSHKRPMGEHSLMPPTPTLQHPPKHLSKAASEVFQRILDVLKPNAPHLLDEHLMTVLVQAIVRHRMAHDTIERYGYIIEDERGRQKSNPAVNAVAQSAQIISRYATLLGITPEQRAKLSMKTEEVVSSDWDDI